MDIDNNEWEAAKANGYWTTKFLGFYEVGLGKPDLVNVIRSGFKTREEAINYAIEHNKL